MYILKHPLGILYEIHYSFFRLFWNLIWPILTSIVWVSSTETVPAPHPVLPRNALLQR